MEACESKALTEDTTTLLKNLDENCCIVENLALNIVNNQHIPLLNSMLCMSKNDCKLILKKYSLCQNMIDQSVLLISMTDFVSCVCANNETFPISMTKKDKNSIKPFLYLLINYWSKFFSKLAVKDMNVNQISTLITLIKRCQDRMPSASYKEIMEIILKMAQKAFTSLNTFHVTESVKSNKLTKPSLKENSVHLKDTPTKVLAKNEDNTPESKSNTTDKSYGNASCDKKLKSHSFDLKKSMSLTKKAPKKVLAKTEANKSESKINTKNKPYGTARYNKKKLKNHTFDITRYILKPCENQVKEPSVEQKNSVTLKGKCDTLTENEPSDLIEEIRDCNNLTVEVIEPPNKKQCLTADYIDGKVNAFKQLMMTQKQREKKTL